RKASATFELNAALAPTPRELGAAEPPKRDQSGEDSLREEQMPNAFSSVKYPESYGLLHLLLNTEVGFWALMLMAAGFGAVHALTPGHGKTLVAAYLVGERGTVWHAFVLGLVTTLTHTGSVLILALAIALYFPDTVESNVQKTLGCIGGLLIAGLGVWLLLARLS